MPRTNTYIQHVFLVLMHKSNHFNSDSHTLNNRCSSLRDGAINKMSWAYRTIDSLLWKVRWSMMSSKSTANKYGDNTEPCLTPKSIFKNADKDDYHLTHVQQLLRRCSNVSRSSTGSFLFISLMRRALWLTLSKAFDRSTAHRLTVLP